MFWPWQISGFQSYFPVEDAIPSWRCNSQLKMQFTVQDEDTAAICKGRQNCQAHKLKRYVNTDRNSNCKELSRNDKKRNRRWNEQCHFHATTVTCKHAFGLWPSCINSNTQIVHLVFNHHVTIPASCKVSMIQLSCDTLQTASIQRNSMY